MEFYVNEEKIDITLENEKTIGDGPFAIDKTFSQLPATIGTRAGILSFSANPGYQMQEGQQIKVVINSPKSEAYKYVGSLSVSQTSKTTTIAQLVISDESPQRAVDYLKQLAICYNRQANEDKNEIAVRTEEFINGRLEKINAELGHDNFYCHCFFLSVN